MLCRIKKDMITEEIVWEKLKECYDPEIPINIVDLGLVYDVKVIDDNINVKMTLTARGCPLHSMISEEVRNKLLTIDSVKDVNVEVVWDPPWEPKMMSAEAKKMLGFKD
jgi:metal-sulfur cluster biosynthetic enzyme